MHLCQTEENTTNTNKSLTRLHLLKNGILENMERKDTKYIHRGTDCKGTTKIYYKECETEAQRILI